MSVIKFQYMSSNQWKNKTLNNYCWLLSDSVPSLRHTVGGDVCRFPSGRVCEVSILMHGKHIEGKNASGAQLLSESGCLFDLNLLLNAGLYVCLCVFLSRVVHQKSIFRVIRKKYVSSQCEEKPRA